MINISETANEAGKLYFQGNFKDALSLYYKILAEDLNNSVNYYNIALVYEALNELELAVSYYKKSIDIDSNNIRSINNLAGIFIEKIKDYDTAEKYLNYVVKIAPEDAEAYNLFGNLSMIKNDFSLAVRYFKKSIFLDENYFKNYYDLAVAYFGLNDKENAIQNVKKSIELNPDFPKAKELLQQML